MVKSIYYCDICFDCIDANYYKVTAIDTTSLIVCMSCMDRIKKLSKEIQNEKSTQKSTDKLLHS